MPHVYRVVEPEVVADIVDGETVIMNLRTGKYFSSDGIGCYCWEAVVAGQTVERIVERLAQAYGCDPEAAAAAVDRFVGELITHQLITPVETSTAEASPLSAPPSGAFEAPVLNVYSDMQELLMLDPIHDVDAAGWPTPKNEALA